ncbi:phosphate ABC transporter permease PstA [Baaleninema simplex]|uniref:phosphate ABC transporter permease PstA n=1 Tax=Baaleninema simplex TaxID=2862350 RepID=UPI000371CB71|nr:phosphate ABC transporter permease PstA [Baaleninema simplex]
MTHFDRTDMELSDRELPDLDLQQPLSLPRRLFEYGTTAIALGLTVVALLPLFAIFWQIVSQGLQHLSLEVLVALPAPVGMEDQPNGFANAILGTMMMVGVGASVSVPFGVMTGIFLSEFAGGTAIANGIRFAVKILSSVPSIVVGVFAYATIVLATKQFSALAGGFALGVIMLPIVTLTTEEALKLVPDTYRLASAGLGEGRFSTTFRAVIPNALPAIVTGVLLAVSRAAGETAPLIFTALSSQNWPQGLLSPTPSLSVLIFNYADSPYREQNALAWTAAFVLLAIVLLVNTISRQVTRKHLK